jgi:hypothetical protein
MADSKSRNSEGPVRATPPDEAAEIMAFARDDSLPFRVRMLLARASGRLDADVELQASRNAAPQASPSVAPADSESGSAAGPAVAAPDAFTRSETRTTQGSGGVSPGETERKETASGPASTDKSERDATLRELIMEIHDRPLWRAAALARLEELTPSAVASIPVNMALVLQAKEAEKAGMTHLTVNVPLKDILYCTPSHEQRSPVQLVGVFTQTGEEALLDEKLLDALWLMYQRADGMTDKFTLLSAAGAVRELMALRTTERTSSSDSGSKA